MPSLMNLYLSASLADCSFTRRLPSESPISLVGSQTASVRPALLCMATSESSSHSIVRRAANYQPSIWHYDYIQSLKSEYAEQSSSKRIDELKGEVRMMIHKVVEPLERLELIDVLQRLGLSYHFDEEIKGILDGLYNANYGGKMRLKEENIHTTAFEFRLLRQYGCNVPQEIFSSFKNERGNFNTCLCDDIMGMLCLYEASFLLLEGEIILDEARDFTTKQLKEYIKESKDQNLMKLTEKEIQVHKLKYSNVECSCALKDIQERELSWDVSANLNLFPYVVCVIYSFVKGLVLHPCRGLINPLEKLV